MRKNINKKALISDFQDVERSKYENSSAQKPSEESRLYGVFGDQKDSESMPSYPSNTLSTRYVPDKPGIQAGRLLGQEGGFYDPITNKEYNFQEGFSLSGTEYPAYSVSMQTDLYSLAKKLKEIGFEKYSNKILKLIK